MPVYEYRCDACACDFERLHFKAPTQPVPCPRCASLEVRRKVSSFAATGLEKQTTSSSGCGSCSKGSCSTCH